ncbi:hypothetical protein MUK42_23809 [Musa troglodytarum]|uniref:TCP domain-containing protein n=1 Tax=Musa troglodytarum TaxID=320322 RepID=A0A9E7KAM3_9LILI|nr:hypothetical protein MUK42_23809 [Musa troglodytarum]
MGEGQNHHGGRGFRQLAVHDHHHQRRAQPRSGFGRLRGAGGEILEVHGGLIVRSTGRKDRHSKVCTAKGPRDRRVRLSAHTAIQFYDVQDRLGYDRPSKAVDWLIKNAKAAIDQLAEVPAWTPGAALTAAVTSNQSPAAEPDVSSAFRFGGGGGGSGSNCLLQPSLDSDAIADTMKSFIPMAATGTATSPSSSYPIRVQNYPPGLLARSTAQTQDLCLSLQSFQDPIFHHHQNPNSASWAEHKQRMAPWNVAETSDGVGLGGFPFSVPPPQAVPTHSVLCPSQLYPQRGALQSSNSPSVRSWAEPMAANAEIQMHPVLNPSVSSSTSQHGFRA